MNPSLATNAKTSQKTETQIPNEMRTKCEIWTRVMGYHRPISQFNIGKKQEAAERQYFSEKVAMGKVQGGDGDDDCGSGCGSCGGCGS